MRILGDRHARGLLLMLVVIALLQFGVPVLGLGPAWGFVYMLGYAAMLAAAVNVAHIDGRELGSTVAAAVLFAVAATVFSVRQDSDIATIAMLVSVALANAVIITSLLGYVFRRTSDGGATGLVSAAVAVYLLIGGFFGALFAIIEIVAPGAWSDPQVVTGPIPWQNMLYFTFVSISTLGYGDIVPTTDWSRMLSSLVGVTGTLYLAIIVARLVSLWGPGGTSGETKQAS